MENIRPASLDFGQKLENDGARLDDLKRVMDQIGLSGKNKKNLEVLLRSMTEMGQSSAPLQDGSWQNNSQAIDQFYSQLESSSYKKKDIPKPDFMGSKENLRQQMSQQLVQQFGDRFKQLSVSRIKSFIQKFQNATVRAPEKSTEKRTGIGRDMVDFVLGTQLSDEDLIEMIEELLENGIEDINELSNILVMLGLLGNNVPLSLLTQIEEQVAIFVDSMVNTAGSLAELKIFLDFVERLADGNLGLGVIDRHALSEKFQLSQQFRLPDEHDDDFSVDTQEPKVRKHLDAKANKPEEPLIKRRAVAAIEKSDKSKIAAYFIEHKALSGFNADHPKKGKELSVEKSESSQSGSFGGGSGDKEEAQEKLDKLKSILATIGEGVGGQISDVVLSQLETLFVPF